MSRQIVITLPDTADPDKVIARLRGFLAESAYDVVPEHHEVEYNLVSPAIIERVTEIIADDFADEVDSPADLARYVARNTYDDVSSSELWQVTRDAVRDGF